MKSYRAALFFIALSLAVLMFACSNEEEETEIRLDRGAAELSATTGSGGGLQWNIPAGWKAGPEKSMRLATYIVEATEGDSDSAECAVFYFGASSGGGTEANIQRWASQFEQPDGEDSMGKAKIEVAEKENIKTTLIDLTGSYLVSGSMMQVTGKKEGYRLLGAIVEGPEGSVFFKFTGPEKTIAASNEAFKDLMKSIRPVSAGRT